MKPELPLAQRISLQLRLGQRLLVSVTVQNKKRERAVGLSNHRKPDHRCAPPGEFTRIDWYGEKTTPESHPHLFVPGCPFRYHNPLLGVSIQHCIDIEDLGGLGPLVAPLGIGHLPWRFVVFYQEVLAARDRLMSERSHVQHQLYNSQ